MAEKRNLEKARKARREVKAPTTHACEFGREEMHQIGEDKRAPRSKKQAVAVGLSKAGRAGIDIPYEPKKTSRRPRNRSAHTYQTVDVHPYRHYYANRSQAILRLLEKEERQPEIPGEYLSRYAQEPSRFGYF